MPRPCLLLLVLLVPGVAVPACAARAVPGGRDARGARGSLPGPPAAAEAPSPAEGLTDTVHVDPGAAPGGDGSRERPLRVLQEALLEAGGRPVRLAPGRYEGPFQVPAGGTLEGPEGAELVGTEAGPVLLGAGGLTLRGLTVRGGDVALAGPGPWVLEGTRLLAQRRAALLRVGGEVSVRGGRVEADGGTPHGLLLEAGGRAVLEGVHFGGPFRRAVEVRGATLQARGLHVEGAETAVHQRGGEVRVVETRVGDGKGPALYVAGGRLALGDVRVQGHEYALLTGEGGRVEVSGFTSVGARYAAVGLVRTEAQVERLEVQDGGRAAGVLTVGSVARLRQVRVRGAGQLGVSVRGGHVELSGAEVAGMRSAGDGDEGDGVVVRAGTLHLEDVTVRDVEGVGVRVAERARLQAGALRVERAGVCGVGAETRGRLDVVRLEVRAGGGPGLCVDTQGEAHVQTLLSEGNREGAVQADCAAGARVRVETLRGQEGGAPSCAGAGAP